MSLPASSQKTRNPLSLPSNRRNSGPIQLRPPLRVSNTIGSSVTPPSLMVLEQEANDFADLKCDPTMATPCGLHVVVSRIHAISLAARQCAEAGFDRAAMERGLGRLREVCRASPFMRHITDWPLGYPGDFEV